MEEQNKEFTRISRIQNYGDMYRYYTRLDIWDLSELCRRRLISYVGNKKDMVEKLIKYDMSTGCNYSRL